MENCEKSFSIEDCLFISKNTGIPLVFDSFHFECYKKFHPEENFQGIEFYIEAVISTWIKKGLRPKFHISEQDKNRNIGAHSDYIENFPDYYLEIPKKYGIGVDVMIEASAKEAAILKLYKKHRLDLLSHIEEKDLPKDYFMFDKKNLQAKLCSRCFDLNWSFIL